MKIKPKLFIIMVSLVIASLFAASFLSINSFSTAMATEIRKHLEDNASHSMDLISNVRSDRISDINLVKNLTEAMIMQSNSNTFSHEKIAYLKDLINFKKIYSSVSIYDENGKKIVD